MSEKRSGLGRGLDALLPGRQVSRQPSGSGQASVGHPENPFPVSGFPLPEERGAESYIKLAKEIMGRRAGAGKKTTEALMEAAMGVPEGN